MRVCVHVSEVCICVSVCVCSVCYVCSVLVCVYMCVVWFCVCVCVWGYVCITVYVCMHVCMWCLGVCVVYTSHIPDIAYINLCPNNCHSIIMTTLSQIALPQDLKVNELCSLPLRLASKVLHEEFGLKKCFPIK